MRFVYIAGPYRGKTKEDIPARFWLNGTIDQLCKCQYVLLTRPDAGLVSAGTKHEVIEAK